MISRRLIGIVAMLAAIVLTTCDTNSAGSQGVKAQSQDWPTYLQNSQRHGYSDTPADAVNLALKWTAHGGAITAEPIISQGVVYWGDWSGYEHAATTGGKPLWSTFIGQTTVWPACSPSTVGVESAATVQDGVVYVGGGDAHMYALNANDGSIMWSTQLGQYRAAFIWDSPLVYGGHVYISTSSFGDCPLVTGKYFELDASTGAKVNVLNLVPANCVGGGAWSSPTLSGQAIYFATGNPGGTVSSPAGKCNHAEPLADSVVEADLSLHVLDHWRIPPKQTVPDSDFGSTPALFDGLVGAINKSGWFYAFRQGHLGHGPVWERHFGGAGLDVAPASSDGQRVYVASGWPLKTHNKDPNCRGSLTALAPKTGAIDWQDCLTNVPFGAPIAAPGEVAVAAGDTVLIVNSSNGKTMYSREFPNENFDGPASMADGNLYIGGLTGTLYDLGS